MYQSFLALRSILFYCVYVLATFLVTIASVSFVFFLPYPWRMEIILLWNRTIIAALKWICGVKYCVHGLENVPKTPYVALANHQSAWETFFLILLLKPLSMILKKELLSIPGFGWGLRLLKPIPIDRGNPRAALKKVKSVGLRRLKEENIPVLVFPEGTRLKPEENGSYAKSGASLAIDAGVPVIFIAHNAGYFWPKQGLIKYPGTIHVYISEAVDSHQRNAADLTQQAEQWIAEHKKAI